MTDPRLLASAPPAAPAGVGRGLLIVLGTLLACAWVYRVLPFDEPARKGLVLLLFVGVLWLTEAVHVTLTALLVPLGALLLGLPGLTTTQALASFADPIIFLFLGGFALATALSVQRLDRKIALRILALARAHLGAAALMLFGATAFLSMWISNTATAAMMLPLALGVLGHLDARGEHRTFVFVLLGIAYSASIGGIGSLIGSPPNAIAARALGLDFDGWLAVGLPAMLILLPLMVATLWLVFRPALNRRVQVPHESIPWTRPRVLTMAVFACTALGWILGDRVAAALGVANPDTVVALGAAAAVVLLGLAGWDEIVRRTDWGVLLLFGGGLTLSAVLRSSGASAVLGEQVAAVLGDAHPLLVIAGVAAFIVILTEFTSNTASAALFVPVFAAVGERIGLPPQVLVLLIGIGASCAFMLPVATPPNAIVFGTGLVRQREMVRAGAVLNAVCIGVLTAWGWFVLR
jgi:sodium-dependent dicarboxylate transporter 2/3/5